MPDPSAESMKFKVSHMGNDGNVNETRDFRTITLDKIHAWIDKKDYDNALKEELKRMVGTYPQNAYVNFGKNFQKHLAKAQKNASKNRPLFSGELGDDNYKKIDSMHEELKPPERKGNITSLPNGKQTINDFEDQEMLLPKSEILNVDSKIDNVGGHLESNDSLSNIE